MQHLFMRKFNLTLHFNRISLIKSLYKSKGKVAPRVQQNAPEDSAPEDLLHSLIIEKGHGPCLEVR